MTPTNILYLPVVGLQMFAATNADWLDGLEYWDKDPPAGVPIDLTGIAFDMEMRTAPPVATVVLHASTANGLIRVYANSWQLLVPSQVMSLLPPADYVFDLLGRADGYTRNLVQAQVTINLGITRTDMPPLVSPASVTKPQGSLTLIGSAQAGGDGMPYGPSPGSSIGPTS